MSVARPTIKGMEKSTTIYPVGKNGSSFVEGVGVKWDGSGNADVCAAGDDPMGIALDTVTGDGVATIRVMLLESAGQIVKVKASGTCTQGSYAACGTGGFQDQAIASGTNVRHLAGKFVEDGVAGDYVGLQVQPQVIVCA